MKGKVLFVDDEADIRFIFKTTFEQDFDIVTASGGLEALKILERQEIDVIISDQRMPGMTGTELLKETRALYPDRERILLTAYSDYEVVVEAINECRIFQFLNKPWDKHHLKLCLDAAVRAVYAKRKNQKLLKSLIEVNEKLESSNTHLETRLMNVSQELTRQNESLRLFSEETGTGKKAITSYKEGNIHETKTSKKLTEDYHKSLLSYSLQISKKNQVLQQVKQKLVPLTGHIKLGDKVQGAIRLIDQEIHDEVVWENFNLHLKKLRPGLLRKLSSIYPTLSSYELRLCSLVAMNLGNKDIAFALNISSESLNTSRYRLRKKLGLERNEDLTRFLLQLDS